MLHVRLVAAHLQSVSCFDEVLNLPPWNFAGCGYKFCAQRRHQDFKRYRAVLQYTNRWDAHECGRSYLNTHWQCEGDKSTYFGIKTRRKCRLLLLCVVVKAVLSGFHTLLHFTRGSMVCLMLVMGKKESKLTRFLNYKACLRLSL